LSTAITKDGQTVATARIPFAAGINSSLVTDATSTTTGSIITAGGVGIAKALFVGTTANIAGTTTLAGVTATNITDSGLTSGRVTYASTGGLLADSANLTFNGTTLTAGGFTTTGATATGTLGATGASTLNGPVTIGNTDVLYLSGNTANHCYVSMGAGSTSTDMFIGSDKNVPVYLRSNATNIATISSTGLAVTGSVTATGTAATNTTALTLQGTTTGFNRGRIFNTGGDLRFGIDSSVGAEAVTGSAAYSSFIGSFTNTPFYLVSNSAIVGTVSSTGLAVTGTLTSTGNASFSTSAGGVSTIGTATPSAWATGNFKGIEINGGASFIGFVGNAQTYMISNLYSDGTNYRYINASGGGLYAIQGVSSGAHVWYSAPVGAAGAVATVTQIMSVEPSKSLSLQGATPQAGTGITFPATQSASTDANTLDDYEEGTWTPADGSGAGLSLTTTKATYVKVGSQVTVQCYTTYPSTANASGAVISGLPFAAAANSYGTAAVSTGGAVAGPIIRVAAGGTTGVLFGGASTATAITNAVLSSQFVIFTGTYFV